MTAKNEILGKYVWPETLSRPRRPPKLVYLDLNHWISLSKAFGGHRDGKAYQDALDACIDAADRGRATFPISDTIYFEISKIGPYRQRHNLRQVIERISRFWVVTGRSVISIHEIEAVLDRVVGPSSDPINTMDYLDWGVFRAFGKVGGLRIRNLDRQDVTDEVRSLHPGGPENFDRFLADAELDLNRKILDGPSREEEPALRDLGWEPKSAFTVAEDRARQELEQVARFQEHPEFPRERIRDAVAVREIGIELIDHLLAGLSARGASLETIAAGEEDIRTLMNSMPSFDVAVTIKTEYHRNPHHRWKANDIADIDALGSTLPYCDVVVTDKAVSSSVTRSGLAQRLESMVLSRLNELTDLL